MNTIKFEIADEARIRDEMTVQGYIMTSCRKLRSGNFMTFIKDPHYDMMKKIEELERRIEAIEKSGG